MSRLMEKSSASLCPFNEFLDNLPHKVVTLHPGGG